jgi:indole-3-glycerol phosphate synthase
MMADLLAAVVAASRRSSDEREKSAGWGDIHREIAARRPRGAEFGPALAAGGVRVIAECKRRSPSRGILRSTYDPAAVAASYAAAGAAAISVLTEPTFFDGALDHLRRVRAAVTLPLLRKDFIVTDYQVAEAAAAGADAVLLIVAALERDALEGLLRLSGSLGLAALVEVHDRDELSLALEAGADLIGVNSRNLRTLEVSHAVLEALVPAIPDEATAVAESGLKTADDLARLSALGYDAFLIGERFMLEPDPGGALAALLQASTAGTA